MLIVYHLQDEILPSLVQGNNIIALVFAKNLSLCITARVIAVFVGLMEFAQETIRRNKLLLLGSSMLVLVVVAPRSFRTLFTDVSASALSKLQN